jgi:hypothetical protein
LGDGGGILVGTLCGDAGILCGDSADIRFGDGTTPSGKDDGTLAEGECGTWFGDVGGILVLLDTRCGDAGTLCDSVIRFGDI